MPATKVELDNSEESRLGIVNLGDREQHFRMAHETRKRNTDGTMSARNVKVAASRADALGYPL